MQARRLIRRLAFPAAIALLAATALYALALALTGAGIHAWRVSALPLFAIAFAAGLIAWNGWRADLAAALEDEETAAGARDELEQLRGQLARERQLRKRVERAREVEHSWNRELREQIVHMHRERGLLGDSDDVRGLVLHMAVTLIEAEKGLLLLRQDRDGDGKLDMICSEGFENDPRESALAQRFASEVIERDQTVR